MIRRASASAFEAAQNRTPTEDAVHDQRAADQRRSAAIAAQFEEAIIQIETARNMWRINGTARAPSYLEDARETIAALLAKIGPVANAADGLKPIAAQIQPLNPEAWR